MTGYRFNVFVVTVVGVDIDLCLLFRHFVSLTVSVRESGDAGRERGKHRRHKMDRFAISQFC